jgi:hypothetical protein
MKQICIGELNGKKQFFGVLINMIYRIGHQAGKAGRKVLEKRAVGGGNVRFDINVVAQLITSSL